MIVLFRLTENRLFRIDEKITKLLIRRIAGKAVDKYNLSIFSWAVIA